MNVVSQAARPGRAPSRWPGRALRWRPGRGLPRRPGRGLPQWPGWGLPRWLAGLPLWLKLAAAGLCLTGVAAGLIGAAGVSSVRGYLIRQAGWQVQADARGLVGRSLAAGPEPGPALAGAGAGEVRVEVLGLGGKPLISAGQGAAAGPAIPASPGWISEHAGRPVTVPARGTGASWRVVAEPVRYQARRLPFVYGTDDLALVLTGPAGPGTRGTLVVAMSLGGIGRAAGRLTVATLVIDGAVIVLLAGLAAALLRASLRPLAALGESARSVAAHSLPGRLLAGGPGGEAGRIARPLNLMLNEAGETARAHAEEEAAARRSRERLCQAAVDACHDLREPLAVIGGFAEYYRRRGPLDERELDRMIGRLAREAARMDTVAGALASAAAAAGDRQPGSVRRPPIITWAGSSAGRPGSGG
jgi:two-component system, OmpR family, sensor kinase